MPPRPAPLPRRRLQAALAAHGAAPRKRHGQHFLLDDNLLAAIVRDAEVGPEDIVLEIGPGPGLLTRHLLGTGARVLAVEIDPLMGRVSQELVEADLRPRLEWLEADVLAGSRRLSEPVAERLGDCTAVVSNLPYNVAGPVLGCLLTAPRTVERIVVMIQREMGERLLAGPSSRDYGPLAVQARLCSRARLLRRVPARAFWPAPAVESAVLRLDLLADRPPPGDLEVLEAFLAAAFHNRRKTLASSLAEASGGRARDIAFALCLEEKEEKLRAEAIGALQLCALARKWAGYALGGRDRPSRP